MNSLLPDPPVIERVAITSPLGVRFLDAATNKFVEDSLIVEAYAPANPDRRIPAVRTPGDIYAFHDLPGLREFQYGVNDERRWSAPPPTRAFVVEVHDPAGRFLPCRFTAQAPHRELFELTPSGSPPVAPAGAVPLFSQASRSVPPGFAVLRAELATADGARRQPAAWTLAEVSIPMTRRTIMARGLADSMGRLALFFPWPEPSNIAVGSPLPSPPQLLGDQSWTVHFRAWRDVASPPAQPSPDDLPDLGPVLGLLGQPPAGVWEDLSPLVPFTEAALIFGRELLVPARGLGDARPRTLLIT